ncbi:hypothetical protein BKA67DRAFT_167188 [Truncatella angustata]|uniref:Protein prenyltransferase n=1 Tax=Truncatella angustata TaxID=152316 RepID=A0A9P8UQZ7_9PEZI|nr:uncharacterized protein BKA67DRAFT_167188 [Truncatella angustata]KAH6656758.1 hypothetical protein BKA67DRAFT_167188 [Truncatella angustata]KAH8196305.1 hypothetical protein TruAng_009517 [Truncatella angustata]
MSRSLDKHVLENLKSEDPAIVYRDIVQVLAALPQQGGLLEIELLGKAHPLQPGINFLQDENAIAIPKLRLTQAFFVARQVIQKHITSQLSSPSDETVASTAVVLLMDPEHLTAANIRKRAILSRLHHGMQPEPLLRHEKQVLDSLLTARLHRHTKSPTLWSHRRWLMERFKLLHVPLDLRSDIKSVIMVAAERHPRNYYAWHHARWLVGHMSPAFDTRFLVDVTNDVKDWCFRHHKDISGWTYLDFIMSSIQDQERKVRECSAVLAETLNMAESFRWTNESLWVFLRTLVARNTLSRGEFASFALLNKRLSSDAKDQNTKAFLDAALQWADQHRQNGVERSGVLTDTGTLHPISYRY